MEQLALQHDWHAIGLSRRHQDGLSGGYQVKADLADESSLAAIADELKNVTHVFFTAYSQRAALAEENDVNLLLLQNLVEVLEQAAPKLRHIQLVHGSKWYGSHRGAYQTPAREDQSRHPLGVFYYAQQDWLRSHQRGKAWTWSTMRPHGIWGFAVSSQLNMMQAVAVYATVMKHMGLPLHFPGKRAAYEALYQCTEASHLARAMIWTSTSPRSVNQAFNITNGDFIRWKLAWPVIANWFDMEVGDVVTFDVAQFMSDKNGIWNEIRSKHGLIYSIPELATWEAAISYMFMVEWDQMSALTKIQKAGWTDVVDTYEMIPRQFDRLARERAIPGPFRRTEEPGKAASSCGLLASSSGDRSRHP